MQVEYNSLAEADEHLAIEMADLSQDPLEWVRFSYPWNEGELLGFDGPDKWQEGFLREWGEEIRIKDFDGRTPVMPFMSSTTSGHGVGKSGLVAWIVGFIMSTRPHCRGRVTANSIPQLETTTWPEIVKWANLMITRRWFRITSGRGAMKIAHRLHPETWRVNGIAWDEHRPAAFAGVHAATSTPFYVFDEASEVARIILETAQGGLTDGEPMMFLFGNPTRPQGYFFDSHHDMRHRFKTFRVDSREAKMTNKTLLKQWVEDYGIDSDYVKVRVLGEFPVTGDRQFVPTNIVTMAMSEEREPAPTIHDPVILGVDVARYGDDESVIHVRRGRDARSVGPFHFRGLDTNQLAMEVRKLAMEYLPDAINVDAGGIGVGVIDALNGWGVPNVNEINFGGTSPEAEYADMATYMLGEARSWLKQVGVCLPTKDPILKRQLTARQYWMVQGKKGTAVKVESKEELKKRAVKAAGTDGGDGSPDRADAFALTFAVPVAMRTVEDTRREMAGERDDNVVGVEYDRI